MLVSLFYFFFGQLQCDVLMHIVFALAAAHVVIVTAKKLVQSNFLHSRQVLCVCVCVGPLSHMHSASLAKLNVN